MHLFKLLGLVLALNLIYFESTQAKRILFLIPLATRSEKHFYEPIIFGLAQSGHSVSVVTSYLSSNLPANVTEIIPSTTEEQFAPFKQIGKVSILSFLSDMYDYFAIFCHKVHQNEEFQEVISQEHDLIFSNIALGLCFYGILHQKQVPYILMDSFPIAQHFLNEFGSILPSSSVPHPYLASSSKMDFSERLTNFVVNWFSLVQYRWYVYPRMEAIYRGYLGNDIPSALEIQKNASLIMMNTYFTSTGLKPLTPNIIEIGCTHCKAPKPLPKDLEEFVSDSPHGVIFFSLGSSVDGSTLANETREMILDVFSRRKEKVIWKFDTGVIHNAPDNVMVQKWLPQQDLLGHPKIRLFISQAGLLSTQQTIYHGVPAFFLPIYFDQFSIAQFAEDNGIAISKSLHDLTEEEFEDSIDSLLTDPSFAKNAKLISSVQKTQMNTPVERAIFWTNFVLKFKGAPLMKSPASNLNIFEIYSVDILATLLLVLLLLCIASIFIIYSFVRLFRVILSFIVPGKSKLE